MGQAAKERRRVGLGESLGLAQTAFLLGGLGARYVASAWRTIHQFALGGHLEAFGNGLFGLLHDYSGAGQKIACGGGCKGNFWKMPPRAFFLVAPACTRILNAHFQQTTMTAPASAKPFIFICGPDDFLVSREGRARFDEIAATVSDEFSREILNGMANNVAEVEAAVNRFRDSVQTISMFGDRRLVWLKDVNFLADTPTGRAESTLTQVENLREILAAIDPAQTAVIITAAPVDKRRSFYKWCEKNADFALCGGDAAGGADALAGVVVAEAKTLGVTFGENALPLLLAKIGANTRLLIEEVHKLANYLDDGATVIDENHVAELTPNVAEGDFFESVETFFSGNLQRTLDALHRHFFNGGDSRPILASLQNRNRLLLQIRALVHSGDLRIGTRGIDKSSFDRLASVESYGRHFAGVTEKTNYNLFSQNVWYLSRLASSDRLPSMRRLIDNQHEFISAFEEIIRRPREQEEVLREMTLRCLGENN